MKRSQLNGERGLILSIVHQAMIDARNGRGVWKESAIEYFQSDYYREHLEWLGLPSTWVPDGVEVQ